MKRKAQTLKNFGKFKKNVQNKLIFNVLVLLRANRTQTRDDIVVASGRGSEGRGIYQGDSLFTVYSSLLLSVG